MLLKNKVLMILILVFSLFALLNYGVHHFILMPGVKNLEISEAKKNTERCIRAIRKEIYHIDLLCFDWAAWDTLYDFMASPAPDFIEKNLNFETMTNNRLNVVSIYDIHGNPVFCESVDLKTNKRVSSAGIPEFLIFKGPSPSDKWDLSGMGISGLYAGSRGPMLLSARPVITTNNRGPIRGTIVLGRLLDDVYIKKLQQQVGIDFRIKPPDDDALTGDGKNYPDTQGPDSFEIGEKNDRLIIYAAFPGIAGSKGFLIETEFPKQITAKGRKTFFYSLTLVSVLFLFITGLVVLLLRRFVIYPIMTLTDHLLAVSRTGDLSARNSISQNDEIGILGRETNRLLDKIEKQNAELAGVNAELKTDIQKRTLAEKELRDSEDRFRRLQEASFGGITIHDKGRIIDVNKTFCTITGYGPEELIGMDGLNLITPECRDTVKSNIRSDYELPYDVEGIRKDGSVFPLEIQGKAMPYKGRMVRVIEFRDITYRKEIERRLKRARDEQKIIVENSQVGIMFLRGGRILYRGNQRLADILGYDSPDEMAGLSMKALHLSEERYAEFGENHFNQLVKGEQIQVEYELRRRDGSPVWCTLSGKAVDTSTPPDLEKGVVWIIDDITQKRHYHNKLKVFATTDYLTGLCNRRHFMTLAGCELERRKRYCHQRFSLIMLDIDHFKKINDTHGHDAGDLVLKTFADIGRKTLRTMDVLARIGGEEFAILLPETDLDGAVAIGERFRRAVENYSVIYGNHEIFFTVSMGITTLRNMMQEIETMMKEADVALYSAKDNGRNRVECYTGPD